MDACPVRVEQVLKATVDRYGPRYHAQVTVPNTKSRWTWHYISAPRIILAPKSSTKTMTRSAGRRFNCSSRASLGRHYRLSADVEWEDWKEHRRRPVGRSPALEKFAQMRPLTSLGLQAPDQAVEGSVVCSQSRN